MDPELVTRWIQWGVVSGIMRFHDRGLSAGDCAKNDPPSCSVVTPWDVAPKYAQANFEALRLRGSMVPYLYTAAFNAHRNGRWFIAPMYYEWPEMESAYQTASPRPDLDAKYDSQYLLGDDLLVAPVVKSANATDDLARMNVWVPPGLWVGLTGGRVLEGDVDGSTSITLLADINEIPIYARAGSIIPSTPIRPGNTIGRARKPYDELVWTVYLAQGGPDSGSGIVYEDDGYSTRYDTVKDYAITTAQYKISDSSGGYGLSQMTEQFRRRVRKSTTPTITLVFTVSTSGRLQKEMCRATTIRFMNTFPPHSVVSNGKELPFSQFGGKDTWHFESVNAALVIELSHADVSKGVNLVVEMQSSPGDNKLILDGFGFQIARAEAAKAALDEIRITPGSRTGQDKAPGNLLLTTSLGSLLEYLAGIPSFASFEAAVRTYPKQLGSAFEEVQQLAHCQNTATISDIGQAGESDTRSLDRVARAISLLQEASSAGTQ